MIRVKNGKTIQNLSKKSLHANKMKNIIAIFAIALTSLMFTSLFTIGGGMLKTFEISTCRQVGTIAHGGYKYMTQKDYDAIKKYPGIKDSSYNIMVGMGKNPEFSKEKVEVRYSEEKSAKWGFNEPTTGSMPVEEMDLATTTKVLDTLGIPHELGQKVTLMYEVNGDMHTDTFRLCGFWDTDSITPAQEVWLSKEYVSKVAPIPTKPMQTDPGSYNIAGYISSDIMFANTWNIEGKMEQVTAACGFSEEEVNSGVNWAYTAASVDIESILMIILVLFLIMVSGYLIIYNVFYISVARDTRYYGLLKTIGTTGRQLRSLVRRQAFLLAIPGIAIGLIAGWGAGVVLLPVFMKNLSFSGDVVNSFHPAIFIGAALFSLITVYISCNKPAKSASKISPMEALHSQEAAISMKKKKGHRVSEWNMAVSNVLRSRKKVVIVVLSLSLSIILLNATYGILKSFSMDKYLENSVISDFNICNAVMQNVYELSYLDADTVKQVTSLEGISDTGYVYMQENEHQLSEQAWKKIKELVGKYASEDSHLAMYQEQLQTKSVIPAHIYGINQYIYNKLELLEGEADWKKFQSGDYVIVTPFAETDQGYTEADYQPGDTVTLDYGDHDKKEYTVLAVEELQYPLTCMHGHIVDDSFILPDTEYLAHAASIDPIRVCLEVEDDKEDEVEAALEVIRENTQMDYVSKAQALKDFDSTLSTYRIIGSVLATILGLIGVLNFLNSILTSIYTRRQELAMLQSIGMTTRQLKKMLVMEGFCYALFTITFVLTVGTALSYLIIQIMAGTAWFFAYHFTILPVFICAPVLFLIAILIPYICYYNVQKQSIVERLREVE